MAFGIQHPNSVNITLHLGKAYEITYVRLKFHTSRPESFAIYKRGRPGGPWLPFQYYSASCERTYGTRPRQPLRPGDDERVAFCSDEFSDISPLSGGNVAFSTLEGRPSAYNFDGSPALQEWVTVTDLLISLNRLNTFGDDIFKDPKVLQSYYYAISDLSVGGRCKCNGHASRCAADAAGRLLCACEHNTAGTDCERCGPFHQDRPWARGTAASANECLPCNCSGRSDECVFDRELYRSTGHGGRCLRCRDNTAGPRCERCRPNHYRWEPRAACQPCHCDAAGSLHMQCDSSGACACKATVTGWKCERCRDGFHSLGRGGCRPCACNPAGSVGTCDPNSGRCVCKEHVEGATCDRCRPGWFNLQPHNPVGCTSCFCYGHSTACTAAGGYEETQLRATFERGPEGWAAATPAGTAIPLHWADGEIFTEWDGEDPVDFLAPVKFLQNQHLSYGQLLSLQLGAEGNSSAGPLPRAQLLLQGEDVAVALQAPSNDSQSPPGHGKQVVTFRLHEAEEGAEPSLSPFSFQRLLSNLTSLRLRVSHGALQGRLSLREVQLVSARRGTATTTATTAAAATWVEECACPPGHGGRSCESCAPGFARRLPFGGPLVPCVPCACNRHGTCDPLTGRCRCWHHTEGPSCERCSAGFHGDPTAGREDDCRPCPCPGGSPCARLPGSDEVVCTGCPPGQRGKRCELCDDGFFGDPLGQRGPMRPCSPCQCNGNVDANAVGNCEPVSGRCLRCLHNTTGERCERCRQGFYGDALAPAAAGKCLPCACSPQGSVPGLGGCDAVTGQCPCLPHVAGRDCGHCQPGYHGLQPAVGCRSCECHPTGSRHSECHVLTGQCSCQPGVEGTRCDRCQLGFFGLSAAGCRACNCSPLGSATPQCHENSTCVCRPGFVGHKCDRCQANFFLDPPSSSCRQCPACYGLLRDEAERLEAALRDAEARLHQVGCEDDEELGDAPRGDRLPGRHLLQGAHAVLVEQAGRLAGSLGAAHGRLRNATDVAGCSDRGATTTKTCALLAAVGAALHSAQRAALRAADTLATTEIPEEIPRQPTRWSRRAQEARALAESHGAAAGRVEAAAGRALRAADGSSELLRRLLEEGAGLQSRRELEARYQDVERAQEELSAGVLEAAAEVKRTCVAVQAHADMAKKLLPVTVLEPQALAARAEALAWGLAAVAEAVEAAARQAVEAPRALAAAPRRELRRTRALEQLRDRASSAHAGATSAVSHGKAVLSDAESILASLEGMRKMLRQRKGQAALNRRMALVQNRTMVEAQRKAKQAEKMLGNSLSMSTTASRTAGEAEQVAVEGAKRAQAVLRESKHTHKQARELATRSNETQQELSTQEHAAGKLRGDLEEADRVRTEANQMVESLQEARGSLLADIETLNDLLSSLGSVEQAAGVDAALSAGRQRLQLLRRRLAEPGALAGRLSRLQREAERQRQEIQAFESDLAEIRADKQNLEAVLRSLPEGCASWR
ncbi:laminin subunit gamma-3 [Nothoprocta perdicaria]|uniref:laminin subunit gamma-3 n=1 Tax=Nothoprocta perdicaria TaxID=30464 RepID=UPI000E1BD884|nr:laminin subunit gamma-3 [Nothoprocta perdicaria]